MANSKDIELAIKARDLASKPIQDIGAAVDKLVSAVGDLVPASEKGSKNLSDMTETAGQLQKAMQGLKADVSLIESFTALSAKVETASSNLKVLREQADTAKLALASAAEPTKALTIAAASSAAAADRQDKALGKMVIRLDALKASMAGVGIDFNNLAASQEKIDAAFNAAAPAYAKVNAEIEMYSVRQREAKVAAEAAAAASAQDAAKKQLQTAAAAESTAMAERFTVAMRQEGSAAAEAGRHHGELSHSYSQVRAEGSKVIEFLRDQRRELTALAAGYVGFMGIFEAAKSGFESIEKLEGTKSILTQTFGAEGAGQQLDYVKAQADRLSLSYVDLARNYSKFAAAASGTGASQSETRQIFETFAEAARVKNLSAEQQSTIFGALDKIFAKDSVGATELFRKLSTDLPEAAAIFRKSIDTLDGTPLTTDQFERLLKSGKITSAFVTKFAADYRASFAEQLPEATNSTTAAVVKFGNAWTQFKIDILEGGALDAFKESLLKLTAFFKSDDGKKFADNLAAAAKGIATGIGLIVDHISELEIALGALAAASAWNIGKSVYGDLMKLVGGFQTLAVTINAAFEAAPLLSKVLGGYAGVLASGFAGFKIGEWLNTNFASVRQFGVLMVGYYVTAFEAVKSVGKAAWAYIFDGASFKDAAAKVARDVKAVNDSLKDQFNEAGKPVAPGEAAGASAPGSAAGGPTPTVMTSQQKADAALAARKVLDDELFTAAKALQTKLSEMRASLLKKDATDLAEYLQGVGAQFKPLYEDIDKLKEEFPHNSQALADKLTAQLNSLKALTLTDATNKFNEDKAKADLKDVNDLLKQRNALIQNETRRTGEGLQSPEQARKNIAGINSQANPGIAASATEAQKFISSLPSEVQTNLKQTTEELKTVLDGLTASTTLKDIKEQEAEINQQLQIRAQRISATEQLRQAGLTTATQEKEELAAIDAEYGPIIQKAKDLITHIQTAKDLTAEQNKALEGVVATLQMAVASAQKFEPALLPATRVADDIASGVTNIASAFTKAAGQGHGLGRAFTSAWQAFKAFSSDFLLKIGEMILKQTTLNALGYGNGQTSGGVPGGISGLVGSLFSGGGSGIAATGAAAAGTDTGTLASTIASGFHGGGMVSHGAGIQRSVLAGIFAGARRFHSGGMPGLQPGEIPIIAQAGERVLSRAEVRAGVGSAQQPQHIQVINGMDHEDIVRKGLAAPSNTKVILNMIRANRSSLRTALA
jgi:hypothetical protein